MTLRNSLRRFVDSARFNNAITTIIVANFFTIYAGTKGVDLEFVETLILGIFTIEMILKLIAYGPKGWSKSGWNWFDGIIVILGLALFVGVPLPQGFSAARSIRLIRLLGRIPSTRILIDSIFNSAKQLGGVGLLSGLCLLISALMATESFQTSFPEYFGSFETSLATLLTMTTFNDLHIIGEASQISISSTLLVFPFFIITVPLTALNLVIAVLSNAIQTVEPPDQQPITRGEFDTLMSEIREIKTMIANRE